MKADQLRKKYLDFFKLKRHAIIPSAPVIPENDPTVLFTTAGMHPLVPYLMGEKHPEGRRLVNAQKCIRTPDIDDVGDNRHLTFFEMLGNWSLGDYFKKEAITWSFEFLTDSNWLGIDPSRIYVTVFSGDENSPLDEESVGFWKEQFKSVGIDAGVCAQGEKATQDSRIFLLGAEDNWWGPAGQTGPCGPCTEMFYDVEPEAGNLAGRTHEELVADFRLMEIWNDVFMEYNKKFDGSFEKLDAQNVDTGMGLERTITILDGKVNVFETDLFLPIITRIEVVSGVDYDQDEEIKKSMRVIADHIKAAVFMIADGVEPSNVDRGYVVRRLIRRAVRRGRAIGIDDNFTNQIAKEVQLMYGKIYPEVLEQRILQVLEAEEDKFRKTLEKGLQILNKKHPRFMEDSKDAKHLNRQDREAILITGKEVFDLYQTYGFPFELTIEELDKVDFFKGFEEKKDELKKEFNKYLQKHQEKSRTASAGMFKGGLADTGDDTKKLHTVAHLMLAGLREILGEHVHQKGSNINGERVRFDFSHNEKLTDEEKQAVEEFVNKAINSNIPVVVEEMSLEDAREFGAEGSFENRYGNMVKVYTVDGFSKEICGGPHVKNTGDIGGKFKIKKEQSSSAGVRRIKAVIEK